MDALHLPRLHASSILPAWRRAWRRQPPDSYVPLPASLSVALPSARAPVAATRLAVPQVVRLDEARTQPSTHQQPQAREPRLRVRQDPADARRVRVAGSMAEVCAALDRLVLWQESEPR